ncbi:S46 family peptidase [Tenuifilum thalassicum]|uniref:Dipeptidyl-peptidase n=1 Tax=Tenuifilum thalassicum TaxID=2590900 RepID=A0A7D4CQV4_9BACT|nr:S46 family peptidase [Tenuifilum thalassicum]QKG79725.1 S46 family peptidase [Tenuifilum thalassicum]
MNMNTFKRVFIGFLILLSYSAIRADEGMWMLNKISQNIPAMKALGFKLTAEDIYSINHSCLKDAIVQFDDGTCSAELVSANGLFFTNHHCGLDAVQELSSVSNNLLENGYWASNYEQELPVHGKTALILQDISNVTVEILDGISNSLSNEDYFRAIEQKMQYLEDSITLATGYYTIIRPFYNYNEFYMFRYKRYRDVRLVGVPPSSIGNFGGDIDNWHWPRHTGDFCVFRIYTSPDGSPADYSPKNIPLKPKRFLKISLQGVNEGDFAMIIGFPGRTHRYATSFEALYNREVVANFKRNVWGEMIRAIKKAQETDPAIKVDYTDKHDYLVNFYQKDVWQAESMYNYNVVERLAAREDSLKAWANRNPFLFSRYVTSLPVIKNYFETATKNRWEETEGALSALSYPVDIHNVINACNNFISVIFEQGKPYSRLSFKKDYIRIEAKKIEKHLPDIFEGYHIYPDAQLYSIAFGTLINSIGDVSNIKLLSSIKKIDNINVSYPYYVRAFYEKSYFSSPDNLKRLIKRPYRDSLINDPFLLLYHSYSMLWDSIYSSRYKVEQDYKRAMQLFTRGVMEMKKGKLLYPDANSTPRLTYGKVKGYKPADGLYYKPFTTLDGVMEKESKTEDIFKVPSKLKQLWERKDYGRYGKDGVMPVCFLTDNDITGGNSGSAVLDANGNLIGIAFDGNAEAMACDFMYEPETQRTIVVDIRYVLFIIDKFGECQHIMNELETV